MTLSPSLFDRARHVTPGGVHSPVRAFRSVGGQPIFFARGEGAHLIDVDGRRYIDFCQSFGPLILGHADPDVAAAVHAALDDGWSFGTCEPYSLALAEWIVQRVPWVERIRFVSSGTEAVISALRVARAATGRSRILKFEGCYHGHGDAMLVQAGSGLAGRVAASSAGVPPGTLEDTLVAPLDDDDALDAVFDQHGPEIAAVILEGVPANYGLLPQRPAWISHLVARCRDAGALLILDEVITGFRSGLRGAADAIGVTPDLVCYGKVIGGGFPVGAYAGRAALMDLVAPAGPVYQAGTLSANPVAMRGGLATLEKLERVDAWRTLEARTSAFVDALSERFEKTGGPAIVRHASIWWLHLALDESTRARPGFPLRPTEHPEARAGVRAAPASIRRPDRIPADQAAWYMRFFHGALQRGVYLPPSTFEVCFLSLAHDEATLDRAIDALAEAAADAARV